MNEKLKAAVHACDVALNKLTKWRNVFAGWQLGTRSVEDPECAAVRDHREVTILLRAESNVMLKLLVEKEIISLQEWHEAMTAEAKRLDDDYQKRFPGFRTTEYGLEINAALARDTTKGWRP